MSESNRDAWHRREPLSKQIKRTLQDTELQQLWKDVEVLEAERDKLLPDASMFAGHSGIPDRETAWQLTYAAAKDVIKDLESRLAEAEKLADKWVQTRSDPYDNAFDDSTSIVILSKVHGHELLKILHGKSIIVDAKQSSELSNKEETKP